MTFGESLASNDDLKQFAYQYRHFYIDKDNDYLREDTSSTFGIYQQDLNYNFVIGADGKPVPIAANGAAIYQHFLAYTNEIVK